MEEELLEDLVLSQKPDYTTEIIEILRGTEAPRVIADKLSDYHEADIADILPLITEQERKKLYRIVGVQSLSDILESMEEDEASKYLDEMDLRKAATIISNMEPDKAVDVLREIQKEKRLVLIDLLNAEAKKDIALIASFDEDEIGSKMTTNYVDIRENLSIKEAMSSLVEQAAQNDNISTIFVVDENGIFFGAVDLKDLIIARQGTKLESLIMTSYPYVYGHEIIDDCIERLKDYSEDSIPVLDNDNTLLGVITSQSIIQVVDEAMGDDYAKLAGLTAEEDLKEPLLESMKKRLPWLLILLVLGIGVSSVVGIFEKVVAELTIIMAFQSLILDMAGNVGTQSLAVTIRVLMDETLTAKQKFGLVGKEMRVGLSNGLLLGIISFLFVGLYISLIKGRGFAFGYSVSACIGASLVVAMVISSAVGTLIPLFFNKIKVDPAVASGPLITTINDLVAVVTYYGLSWILLIEVFHLGG
ncbi:MAG: magnesium transporter [Lachnospiraceae bacterium]|nr:magnesium transporter [Lachnospiraceae bacterium]